MGYRASPRPGGSSLRSGSTRSPIPGVTQPWSACSNRCSRTAVPPESRKRSASATGLQSPTDPGVGQYPEEAVDRRRILQHCTQRGRPHPADRSGYDQPLEGRGRQRTTVQLEAPALGALSSPRTEDDPREGKSLRQDGVGVSSRTCPRRRSRHSTAGAFARASAGDPRRHEDPAEDDEGVAPGASRRRGSGPSSAVRRWADDDKTAAAAQEETAVETPHGLGDGRGVGDDPVLRDTPLALHRAPGDTGQGARERGTAAGAGYRSATRTPRPAGGRRRCTLANRRHPGANRGDVHVAGARHARS